jgi:heptosyltransferase-2
VTRIHPKHLIVKCPNWLGDVMMVLPTLKAIRRDNPECRITLFWHRKFEPLFEFLPWADDCLYHESTNSPGAWKEWVSGVKKSGADATLICVNNFKSALLMALSGVRYRLGFNNGRGLFMNCGVTLTKELRGKHRRLWYETMAQALLDGPTTKESAMELKAQDQELDCLKEIKSPFVVLATGAAYGPAKEYKAEHFQTVIKNLEEKGFTCVLIGAPPELEKARQIATISETVVNLVSKTSMGEMLLVLARADGFIGNDSGPMHVSAMLGKPTLGIFGSTHPDWTGPVGPKASFLYNEVDCSPCYNRHCQNAEDKKMICSNSIEPSSVIAEFEALFKSEGNIA